MPIPKSPAMRIPGGAQLLSGGPRVPTVVHCPMPECRAPLTGIPEGMTMSRQRKDATKIIEITCECGCKMSLPLKEAS